MGANQHAPTADKSTSSSPESEQPAEVLAQELQAWLKDPMFLAQLKNLRYGEIQFQIKEGKVYRAWVNASIMRK